MALFRTKREKQFWVLAALVVVGIFTTLFAGRPFLELLQIQDLQALFFLAGMAMVALTVLATAISPKTSKVILVGALAIVSIYLMLFLRSGLAERSHLIEYSVLAALVFSALKERSKESTSNFKLALFSFAIAFAIGNLDEFLQFFIPDRYFDPVDILFNGLSILLALGAILLLDFLKKRISI